MSRISFTVCAIWLLVGAGKPVAAQTSAFSISAGAGIAGLDYSITGGSASLKTGYQGTLGYTIFLNRHWGIATGMELGYYQTNTTLTDGKVYTTNMVDSENEGFEWRMQAKGYQEKQRLYTLNVPLMAYFQLPAPGNTQWYAKGGFKFSLPLRAPFSAQAEEIRASGYYPNLDLLITDLPAHGFGKQTRWSGKGNYSLNPAVSLSAETGARFRIGAGRYVYAGAYIDYGLNNINKGQEAPPLISYNLTDVSRSQATGIFSLANTTGNVRLIAYGIRLGYSFAANRSGR